MTMLSGVAIYLGAVAGVGLFLIACFMVGARSDDAEQGQRESEAERLGIGGGSDFPIHSGGNGR